MARKKAEVTEEIKEIEVVETPVAEVVEDKPKKSRKKKVEEPVVEVVAEEPDVEPEPVVAEPIVEPEPVVEEVKVEEPVVEAPVVEEVKPEPVKEKKAKKADGTYKAIAKRDLYVVKAPGMISTKVGSYRAGIKFDILEESMGWGKIADGKWVNLNYVEKI